MDADFVRRHLKSGKSRLRVTPKYPEAAYFGAAKSSKFIRSYFKPPIDGYRIELQLNPNFLETHGVKTPADFVRLAGITTSQIRFFDVDWPALSRSIRRHYPRDAAILLRKAREHSDVLTELLKFLRAIGITNPTRFLIPMAINRTVSAALRSWARRWAKG